MNPYEQHASAAREARRTGYEGDRQRKLATVDNFVASWKKRPLLCRLHIHRPVVWADRPRWRMDLLPPTMPHCGTCGYEWDGYL